MNRYLIDASPEQLVADFRELLGLFRITVVDIRLMNHKDVPPINDILKLKRAGDLAWKLSLMYVLFDDFDISEEEVKLIENLSANYAGIAAMSYGKIKDITSDLGYEPE
jgi:hypothetical protein